jgi:hypothetical protein
MLDFDRRVKRIASQPFCLVAAVDGKRLKRTIDYLALTDEGPRAIDVKRLDELERIDVHDVLVTALIGSPRVCSPKFLT